MSRPRRQSAIVPAAVVVGGAVAMALLARPLAAARAAAPATASDTPWVRYVMVGLGGFRGVVSEVLWLRAARLQEQGRYFELVQLSDWINALDPRATDAWAFNAWNLAYNISAMLPDHAARLRWVEAGISLLRDRAIPANPAAPSLYRELGWLYQNKVGASDDDAHLVYKRALAEETARDLRGEPVAHPLDPAVRAEVEARFGPLDWRLPQAHAIYWAWRGLALNPQGFERAALRRMVLQNLVALVSAGRLDGDPAVGEWKTSPCFDLVPRIMAYYEERALDDPAERRVYCIFLDAVSRQLRAAGRDDLAAAPAARLAELGGIESIKNLP